MIKRTALVATACAAALVAPALAATSHGHHAAKRKVVRRLSGTLRTAPITSTGAPPLNGTELVAGVTDGTVGSVAVHGALRGTLTFSAPNFTGSGTIFVAAGAVNFKNHGTGKLDSAGNISFSGSGTFTGGTGPYKGAHGTFTFTGSEPKGSNVATFNTTGKLITSR